MGKKAHIVQFIKATKGPDVAPAMMTGITAYPRYGDFLGQQKLS